MNRRLLKRMNWAFTSAAIALAACTSAISGCRNAVYFYQRDALSLTAEGRLNDPTSPVSANLGFKERVVLVVPPSDATSAAEMTSGGAQSAGTNQQTVGTNLNIESSPAAPGDPTHTTDLRPPKIPKDDAVSVISYFDFVKANGDRVINPGLTIRSSFITGAAARAVTKENKTAEVAKAITGFETLNRADMTAISAMYDVVKTRTDDDEAVAVIAQLDGLFKQVPTTWPVDVFATGSGSAVTMIIRDSDRVHEPVTSRVSSQGFEGLQQYWSSLRESHKLLSSVAPKDAAATKPASFATGSSLNGTSLTDAASERARRIVLEARERTREQIETLEARIAKSGAVSRLVAYYSGTFGK